MSTQSMQVAAEVHQIVHMPQSRNAVGRRLRGFVAGTLILLGTATVAKPDSVVYSDYGSGMTASTSVGWCVSGSTTAFCGPAVPRWVASPFTPSGSFSLTQIDLALGYNAGTNGVTVELVNSQNGLPGSTVLEYWTASSVPPLIPTPDLSLTSTGGVILQSGTQYWIVAMGTAGDTLDFWFDEPTGLLQGSVSSLTNGASWFALSGTNGVRNALTAFDVLGTPTTPTPEPGSLTFVIVGLLGLITEIIRR